MCGAIRYSAEGKDSFRCSDSNSVSSANHTMFQWAQKSGLEPFATALNVKR
jgi:hypothetical protein